MQSKGKKAVSVVAMASLLITSSAMSANVKAATVTPPESPRLWGADRYETAVKVSQAGWTSGSDYAVIASGEGYADALCAAPLAKANNAPILLTEKGALNQNTLNELKRLNVKNVYIVGGQGVVSQSVEDKIKSEVTTNIQRLWGQDRYETAVRVAEKLGTSGKIVLASGEGYADALSAAPVAAIEGMPILLTESKTLSKPTADYIKSNSGITKTYVIGGYASVSDAAMSLVPSAQRISGSDRYETNAAVINTFTTDFDFKNAYVALGDGPSGNEFADALTASALAAKNKNPLIITGKTLSDSTKNLIKAKLNTNSTLTILGGTANLSDGVVSEMTSARGAAPTGGGSSSSGSSTTYFTTDRSNFGTITGDAYVTASATITNGTITGTLYINAGDSGEVTLNSVTANNIVVQSAAESSVKFKNTQITGKLTVQDPNGVRVVTEGTTQIAATEVKSKAILQSDSGSFGNVKIMPESSAVKVQLKGAFQAVTIEKAAELDLDASANILNFIVDKAVNSQVNFTGTGIVTNIQNRSTANLNIPSAIKIQGTIYVVKPDSIIGDNSAKDRAIVKAEDQMNNLGTIEGFSSKVSLVVSLVNLYKTSIDSNFSEIKTDGNTLTITLKNADEKLSTNYQTLVNKPNLIENMSDMETLLNFSSVTIGGYSLDTYLKNHDSLPLYDKYIFTTPSAIGTSVFIENGQVAQTLQKNSFAQFIQKLNDAIGAKNIPSIVVQGYTVDKVTKEDTDIYNSAPSNTTVNTVLKNVLGSDLTKVNELSDLTYAKYKGTYKIYLKGISTPYTVIVQ